MKVAYFKDSCLVQLKHDVGENALNYQTDSIWIDNYFSAKCSDIQEYYKELSIEVEPLNLKMPDGSELYDFENAREVYQKMKEFTPFLASDEHIWALMCHTNCWSYMRKRWPVSERDSIEKITERYLFSTNKGRALVRNGLSRLWWFGYLTYDPRRSDQFELTKVLTKNQDIMANMLERNFSRNRNVLTAILESIEEHSLRREEYREIARHLNRVGGVALLDYLAKDKIKSIINTELMEIREKAVQN